MKLMNKIDYSVVQDGILLTEKVNDLFKNSFDYGDISNTDKGYFINFVGFIIYGSNVLVSFPKHFFSDAERVELHANKSKMKHYIQLLYKAIKKSTYKKTNRHIGFSKEFNKSYPFEQYYTIYDYYLKNGLYMNEEIEKKFGYRGKISWKDTMNKSPILINQGNLIYMPMVIQKTVSDYVFISKCMAYVIDSTIDKFNFLLSGKKTHFEYRDINFENKQMIISKLRTAKQSIFKDMDKNLIENLITFFQEEYKGTGIVHLTTHNFNLIWEDIMLSYLNKYFNGIDFKTKELILNDVINHISKFNKETFFLDERQDTQDTYSIQPDFYYVDDDIRYIFDAKYYKRVTALDYKQIAYYFLLKWKNHKLDQSGNKTPIKTLNALFLPTTKKSHMRKQIVLDKQFIVASEEFIIIEYYINTIDAIEKYV